MNAAAFSAVTNVYNGSDGDATKALYSRLERFGPAGTIAVNLLRANKNSERAKKYRGGIRGQGSYRGMAYERKSWAMSELAKALTQHGQACGIIWGWGIDHAQDYHNIVLYVDLPTGQVSFHTDRRGAGPDYPGKWDGVRGVSPQRVCAYAARILSEGIAA